MNKSLSNGQLQKACLMTYLPSRVTCKTVDKEKLTPNALNLLDGHLVSFFGKSHHLVSPISSVVI